MPPTTSPSLWDHPPRELAHALFQEASDAILLVDAADHHILDANPAAVALTGASRGFLIGSDANELLESADPSTPLSISQQMRVPHTRTNCRLRTAAPAGWIPVGVTASRLPGAAALAFLVLRDMRELNEVKRQAEQAEEARQQSETRYRNMVEGSLQGIMIHQDGRICYANPALARMFGYDGAEELVGRHLWETFVRPENRPTLVKRTAAILAGESIPPHPGWCGIGKDGREIWVATAASLVEWNGRPAVVAFYLDITEHKRAEESLRASERFVHAITHASPHTMYVFDRIEGRNIWANRQIAADLGYAPEEIQRLGSDFMSELLYPDDLKRLPALLARWETATDDEVLETEYRMRHADGTWRWFVGHDTVFSRTPDGRVQQFIGTTQDITERKRTEESLRESQALYASLVEALPVHLFRKDEAGRFVFANERFCALVGRSLAELLGKTDDDISPAELAASYRADDLRVLRTGVTLEQEEQNRHPDGTPVYVHVIKTPVRDADGRVVGVQGVFWDVTARKHAEDERRQSEARLASVIANSPGMAIQWYDRAGRVVLWNRASEEMFGYTAAEAVGKTLDQLIHTPEEFATFLETCAAIARTGEPIAPTEYTFRRRAGEPGVCLSTLFRIPGPNASDWFVCMDIDITERKRAEEERRKLEAQVRQTQKLESLGILAGGIAHDFNNLLTSVLGYASLASMELPRESTPRQMIGEIEKAAQRAAELTQQMLAYSGRGKFVVQVLELDGLVREMNKLLQTVVSKKAAFQLELAPAATEADATQLRQVVMNLITNASDALEGRPGAIAIRTGTRVMDAGALRSPFLHESLPSGNYVYLEVADSGCGMTEETLNKIFDPFFTTKFTGRGLGLAAVLGIIRGHRGSLQIASSPGAGTTFRVFLPAAPAPVRDSAPAAPLANPTRGHGSVLVVDDEENVRDYTQRVLERAGFRVLLARDGIEAVTAVREHRQALRAVVLDLTMPRMDGWEVANQLRGEDPDLPIVLMSGYSEPELARRDGRANIAGFLQKPFRPGDLLDLVRRFARDLDESKRDEPHDERR